MLRKVLLALCLLVILVCGVTASWKMATSAPTYNGRGVDLMELYENPTQYDHSGADGAASVIVKENLDKTAAENVVYSVVFNFRGYDTLGESFILIGAIAGTLVILRYKKKEEEEQR